MSPPPEPSRSVSARRLAGLPAVVPTALVVVAGTLVGLYWLSGRPGFPLAPQLFDLDGESNIPALFSATLWFGAALLALACMRRSRLEGWRLGFYWPIMAALFLYLGIDEAVMIHERTGDLMGAMYEFTGAFSYAWVVAGLAFLAIVGLIFLKFLLSLRPVNLGLLILAAAVFVSGAVGFEMMAAAADSASQGPAIFPLGLNWRRAIALEEGLELLGVILLIHVLLRFLNDPGSPFRERA